MLQRVLGTLADQFAHARVHQTQPTFYLTIVGIGLAEAMAAGPQPLTERLTALPAFLDQARRNLQGIPRLFRDLGTDVLGKQQEWIASLLRIIGHTRWKRGRLDAGRFSICGPATSWDTYFGGT